MTDKNKAYILDFGFILLLLAFLMSFISNGVGGARVFYIGYIYLVLFAGMMISVIFAPRSDRVFKTNLPLVIFFFLYLIWLLIEPYFSGWYEMSRFSTHVLMLTPISFFIVSYITPTSRQIKILYITFLCTGLFLFVWSLLHFQVTSIRPSGPFIDANVFSGILLFFLIPVVVYWLISITDKPKQKKIHEYLFLYVVFGFLAFFTTYSRSATGALLVVGLLILYKLLKSKKIYSIKKLLLLLAVVASTFSFINYQFDHNQISESLVRDIKSDVSAQTRLMMWKSSVEMFKESNPIVGIGFAQYKDFYPRYRNVNEVISSGDHAHNDYIEFLLEGGLIQLGFIIILSAFIIFNYYKILFKGSLENASDVRAFIALNLCCVYFIQANVNFIFYVTSNAILIGALLGYFNRHYKPANFHLKISKVSGVSMLAVSVLSLAIMFMGFYAYSHFYVPVSKLGQTQYEKYFEKSNLLSNVLPRSASLSSFNIKYKLQNLEFEQDGSISVGDYEYINNELSRLYINNKYDHETISYLAKYANDEPEIFKLLAKKFPDQKLLNMSPEQLYLLALEFNPLLVTNYFALREIYKEQNKLENAYYLMKDQLYTRPDFRFINAYHAKLVLNYLLSDAIELGFNEDARQFAKKYLLSEPCDLPALKVLSLNKPETCS